MTMVVMKENATKEEIQHVMEEMRKEGAVPYLSKNGDQVVVVSGK